MVSSSTVGTFGVGAGVVAIVIGWSDVGFGLILAGIIGVIAVEAAGWGKDGENR